MSFKDRINLQIINHTTPGKNSALNAALPYVDSDLIVFTDDDIIPSVNWLNELYFSAIAKPEYSVFGGIIEPEWGCQPPAWILDSVPLGPAFGCSRLADNDEGETSPFSIWGANMMIRTRLLIESGIKFSEEVGPRPGSYVMGSETDLTRRLSDMGERCWFVPKARVKHIIREQQLTVSWLLARAIKFGRSVARDDYLSGAIHQVPSILGVPRWRVRAWLTFELMGGLAFLFGLRKKFFQAAWNAHLYRGYLMQSREYV